MHCNEGGGTHCNAESLFKPPPATPSDPSVDEEELLEVERQPLPIEHEDQILNDIENEMATYHGDPEQHGDPEDAVRGAPSSSPATNFKTPS
eukprot:SAG31_NODE_346_length_17349_cov_9.825875_3_plen_92_part_00